MNWIKTLFFLMIAPALTDDTDSCEPVKALFIWHTSRDDMSFNQGMRLLISVIGGLPQGTDVILKTIGADANIDKQFQKNAKDITWMNELSIHKPRNSGNHTISSNDIDEAVFKYLDQNTSYTPKRAEEVFLIVTDKSVIDNESIVTEALKKKKTFVVVYGELTDVWTHLATDNNHLKELDNTTKNVKNTGKSLLELSCKDSSFICDTDQYWTGERCYRCSYICSTIPSEYCLKKCPHLKHTLQDTDSGFKTPVKNQNDCETNNSGFKTPVKNQNDSETKNSGFKTPVKNQNDSETNNSGFKTPVKNQNDSETNNSGFKTPVRNQNDCETNNVLLVILVTNTCMLVFLCFWMIRKPLMKGIKSKMGNNPIFQKKDNEVPKTGTQDTSKVLAQTSDSTEHQHFKHEHKDTVFIDIEERRNSRSSDENGFLDITASKEPIPDPTRSLSPPQGANPETMGLLKGND